MKENKNLIIFLIFMILVLGLLLDIYGVIGTRKNGLEYNARKSQSIEDSWVSIKDTNNDMAALLFYDKALDEHTYAIYLNKPGFSYGYFFSRGGSLSTVDEGIQGFSSEKGMVLISMNKKKVSQIKLENDTTVEIIKVDSEKPFVVLVPSTMEKTSLFDDQGNNVSIDNITAF
jgi:hypothetical protein